MVSIKNIGEFGLIDRLKRLIKTDTSVVKGTGDDCAVVRLSKDKYMLLTCDMIVAGGDFSV
jgi:thiamine-monophosphate kinase